MNHSDANDQSAGPFESVAQIPWQGPEEELYQEKRQPHQPMDGPEAQFCQSLREDPVQTAWRESPPVWNTSGKLSVSPSAKQPVRGTQSVAMLALTMVIASVFGVGLFAGWTFSRGAGILTGTNSLLTVPSLTSNTIEAVREAAIA